MTILLASLFCAILTYILTVRHYRIDTSQLTQPRGTTPTLGIQIICGNCSGPGERPIKTFLGHSGTCEQCGGHSYILAANRFASGRDFYPQHCEVK